MMISRVALLSLLALTLVSMARASSAEAAKPSPGDWPMWRGPEMNGISRAKNLPSSWSPEGENLLWKSPEFGGRSTPIVLNGKLYTLVRHMPQTLQEAEKVVCVDAKTGKKLWENVFNVFESDVPDTRVGWSSVVGDPETGHVFALGVCGLFQCLDGETGKTLWQRSLSEEFGLLTTYGGRTNFPIVFENLAIIGGVLINWGEYSQPAHRILAFDKTSGELVWLQTTKLRPEDTTYSTPVYSVINGQAQLVIGAGDGSLYGFQPRTGKEIWHYDVSPRGINTSPVISGSMVICGHGEENLNDTKMGALFAIDATKTGDITKTGGLWLNKEQSIGKCSPLVIDGRVYAIDESGTFYVVDQKTGKLIGKTKIGTMARATPVYGDGKIYTVDATGRWAIFEPAEKGLKKIHQLRLEAEVNASPIIAEGRLYVTTDNMLYCIGNADQAAVYDPIPQTEPETPVAKGDKPAQALVYPAEVLLSPSKAQTYSVRLYNANGRFLETADPASVKLTVQGPGTISGLTYTPDPKAGPVAAILTAEVGGLKATSRVRVIPPPPLKFEFSDGVVPITGIGMRYRHIGIDYDLWKKLNGESELAAKCYIYLTTQFTNLGRDQLKIDDSTPTQPWTTFRRYLNMLNELTTQELASAKLDPALEILKREGVLAGYKWAGTKETGAQLLVTKGPRPVQGNGVLCKITTIPKGVRSQGWIGASDWHDYTVQADVYSAPVEIIPGADPNARMPDIGIMDQRYRLEMMGASQELKIFSWYPHDQKYHAIPFAWKSDIWYTMKMQVTTTVKDGRSVAVIEGKVWKKGEPEPTDWTIRWTDSPPNEIGSPGLSGNAKDTEIFFDNVTITPRSAT